jgi:arylsulfatase A-like enzyme
VRRNILFVTTDQQRYDALGCNGNTIARTPVIDRLAAAGINYRRAYFQNSVCMPARSTMLTGQHTYTHGVLANGIPLPHDAPSVAAHLAERAGYRTALVGKAHFDPGFDPDNTQYEENRRALEGDTGPWRGFDYSIQAMHTALYPGKRPAVHYGYWIEREHPEHRYSFAKLLSAAGGGDTGAPETKKNPIPRDLYHTDWVADRTIDWLSSVPAEDPFFCWMSFPDPHHPWDPPASELERVPWRDLDLPAGHPGSAARIEELLARKPAHWLACWQGTYRNLEGGPASYAPGELTDDMIREVNAKTHVMNELIDEALGRVLDHLTATGRREDTDVIFTTDHGEMQGDLGFLFKGPWPVDALMRLPMVWCPAPSAGAAPAEVVHPVGHVDQAPTFCAIAGVEPAEWMQGEALPVDPADAGAQGRERVLSTWDSQFPGYGMHLRSIVRDGWLCTAYEPSTGGQPNGLEKNPVVQMLFGDALLEPIAIQYDGTEGELYRLDEDPHQWHNLWDDPAHRSTRDDLVDDLRTSLAGLPRRHLEVEAPT